MVNTTDIRDDASINLRHTTKLVPNKYKYIEQEKQEVTTKNSKNILQVSIMACIRIFFVKLFYTFE